MSIQHIEELTSPPVIGRQYLVPHVNVLGWDEITTHWIPVFLPAHDDSEFIVNASLHYHIDQRFMNTEHNVVFKTKDTTVEMREAVCILAAPQVNDGFYIFGPKFAEKFKGSKMKCGKCPHRGINLASMEVRNGVIECPAHGLKFHADTKECTLTDEGVEEARQWYNHYFRGK